MSAALALPLQPVDFSRRSTQCEVMDSAEVSPADYAQCLKDLAQVNRFTRTHASTLAWLEGALPAQPTRPVRILDVAFGHGDLLRSIWRWAKRRGVEVQLQGVDLNPRSAPAARAATPPRMDIDYCTGDVFTHHLAQRPDFIVSSQFAHHLDDDDVVRLLRWLERTAARGWCITDLQRHPVAYYGFPVLCRLAGWHRIVRDDGVVSIARSFRSSDWQRLLEQAGVAARVRAHFPFRLCVDRLAAA
jgi:SAM-dependent methyltransferase